MFLWYLMKPIMLKKRNSWGLKRTRARISVHIFLVSPWCPHLFGSQTNPHSLIWIFGSTALATCFHGNLNPAMQEKSAPHMPHGSLGGQLSPTIFLEVKILIPKFHHYPILLDSSNIKRYKRMDFSPWFWSPRATVVIFPQITWIQPLKDQTSHNLTTVILLQSCSST